MIPLGHGRLHAMAAKINKSSTAKNDGCYGNSCSMVTLAGNEYRLENKLDINIKAWPKKNMRSQFSLEKSVDNFFHK